MKAPTILLLVTLALAETLVGQTANTGASSPCFQRLIQPTGWAIPEHARKASRTGAFKEAGIANITFSIFSVTKPFFLPHYYVENGALNLVSLRFLTKELKRLEVAGQPFAFVAAVRGADVGTAGSVWWVDRDGNGSFEEFAWNPNFSDVPEWVRRKANGSTK